MGSVGLAGWIAQISFLILMLGGWRELWPGRAILFAVLWLAGYTLLPLVPGGEPFFMPFVAVLDIALVFIVFYGDERV